MEETQPLVFQAVTRINKDLYFEAVKVRGKNLKNRCFTVFGILIAVVGLLMHQTAVLVLGLTIAVLAMFSHIIIGYRDYHKLCLIHPEGEWTKTVSFYGDRIETDSGSGQPTVARYEDIRHELQTEHMYLIDFGKKAPATTFCKADLTGGTLEEFTGFLTEKQRQVYNQKTRRKD